jgi:hypothetical protein
MDQGYRYENNFTELKEQENNSQAEGVGMRASVLDRAQTIYLNVHTPEEQSTFFPLIHCQKVALGPLEDGGDC